MKKNIGRFLFFILISGPLLGAESQSHLISIRTCFEQAQQDHEYSQKQYSLITDQIYLKKLKEKNQNNYFQKTENCKIQFKKNISKLNSLEDLMTADVLAREYFKLSETDFIFYQMHQLNKVQQITFKKNKENKTQKNTSALNPVCQQPSYFNLIEELMSGQVRSVDYEKGTKLIHLCVPLEESTLSLLVSSPMKGQALENICQFIKNKLKNSKTYPLVCKQKF